MLTHLNCFIIIMLLPSLAQCGERRLHKYLFGVNLLWLQSNLKEKFNDDTNIFANCKHTHNEHNRNKRDKSVGSCLFLSLTHSF